MVLIQSQIFITMWSTQEVSVFEHLVFCLRLDHIGSLYGNSKCGFLSLSSDSNGLVSFLSRMPSWKLVPSSVSWKLLHVLLVLQLTCQL